MTSDEIKEIEKEVLHGLIFDVHNRLSGNVDLIDTIKDEMFQNSSCKEVFISVKTLKQNGEHVDLLSVVKNLSERKRLEYIGGAVFVSQLGDFYTNYDQFRHRILLMHENHFRKRISTIASEMQNMALNESLDVFNVISQSVTLIDELNSTTDIRKERSKKEILEETISDIEKRKLTGINGVSSGIIEIDSAVGGFEGVVIVAGRPGSGKTAFALSIVNKMVCEQGLNGVFFSLEMSSKSLYQRFLAINGNIRSSNIWKGQMKSDDWDSIGKSFDKINDAGIEVFDKYFSISEIVAKCRSMHLTKPLEFIVVDYLQLIVSDSKTKGNREQEVSGISRALKILSMQLNIPVIALSQLSRACETRGGDKRPILSDLRESGSIEQDASTVLFTYRPSYYGFLGESGESLEDKAYLIMGKHRNGALKDIELHYKHDLNQEWCTQQRIEPNSFVVDEFQKNNFKPNIDF
jgi:replicative DNA helicase